MTVIHIFCAVIAVFVFGYLIYALLNAEDF